MSLGVEGIAHMKNVLYLILGIVFFAAAYVVWAIAQESGVAPSGPSTRSLSPTTVGPVPPGLMAFVQQWQPVLTLASSLGGIISFIIQIRVWMRGRG